MGLLLSKGTKTIFIKGTEIELENCYARIEFFAQKDGITVKVNFDTYLSFEKFQENRIVETDISIKEFDFAILETETQSIDVVLQYCVLKFNDFGYNAEIVLQYV
jgi:hypothetical protein